MAQMSAGRVAPSDRSTTSREHVVERPLFWDASLPIRRVKSLSNLRSALHERNSSRSKRHFLQRIPRRTSFAETLPPQPDALGYVNIGFSEDGIHSCSYCAKVDLDFRGRRSGRDPRTWFNSPLGYLNITYGEAQRAARSGCPLFYLLGSSASLRLRKKNTINPRFGQMPDEVLSKPVDFRIGEMKKRDGYGATLRFNIYSRSWEKSPWRGERWSLVRLEEGKALPKTVRLKALPPLRPTESFDTVRSWLSTCDSQHTRCSKPRNNFIPKRLIHVNHKSRHGTVALVCPDSPVDYAALTYCWGRPLQFKTTSYTLQSALTGVPVELLPATIQDAIRVTREIGLEYIWVDSICIIQDDEDDMVEQIAQMAQIFEGSYVTIAATEALRSSDGFLESINPFRLLCKVTLTTSTASKQPIALGSFHRHDPGKDPLMRRAWTLQETLLSRRIISFEWGHVHWYCADSCTATCGSHVAQTVFRLHAGIDPGHEAISGITSPTRIQPKSRLPFYRLSKLQESREDDQICINWKRFVFKYSGRQLTFHSDKLRAISAAAEVFGRSGALGRYLAGMWEKDLLLQLGWQAHPHVEQPPCKNMSVPSWSWASSNGFIEWTIYWITNLRLNISCEVISAEVDLVSPHAPFGDVSGGRLKLKGRLKTAYWAGDPVNRLYEDTSMQHEVRQAVRWDQGTQSSGSLVHFLEILQSNREGHSIPAQALVLIQCCGSEEYQRVGCLDYYEIATTRRPVSEISSWWLEGWKENEVMIV